MSGKGVNTADFLLVGNGIPGRCEALGVFFCIIQRAFG